MVAGVANSLRLLDGFYALGLGVLVGAFYTAAKAVLGGGKLAAAVCDVAAFALAFFLLTGYTTTYGFSSVVRWYMALPALAGCVLFTLWFSRPAVGAAGAVKRVLFYPLSLLQKFVLRPLKAKFVAFYTKKKEKPKKKWKKSKKDLPKKGKVLYNSN